MNDTIVKTGHGMPKKIAILDHTNNVVVIRSLPEVIGSDIEDIEDWFMLNGYGVHSEYMVGDFEIEIDN